MQSLITLAFGSWTLVVVLDCFEIHDLGALLVFRQRDFESAAKGRVLLTPTLLTESRSLLLTIKEPTLIALFAGA